MCIHYHQNVFTKPLPSNEFLLVPLSWLSGVGAWRGVETQPSRSSQLTFYFFKNKESKPKKGQTHPCPKWDQLTFKTIITALPFYVTP
jgi:hypothetical protein